MEEVSKAVFDAFVKASGAVSMDRWPNSFVHIPLDVDVYFINNREAARHIGYGGLLDVYYVKTDLNEG